MGHVKVYQKYSVTPVESYGSAFDIAAVGTIINIYIFNGMSERDSHLSPPVRLWMHFVWSHGRRLKLKSLYSIQCILSNLYLTVREIIMQGLKLIGQFSHA